MAVAARDDAATRFSEAAMLDAYEDLYASVLHASPSATARA
jgi:hypothetical protein